MYVEVLPGEGSGDRQRHSAVWALRLVRVSAPLTPDSQAEVNFIRCLLRAGATTSFAIRYMCYGAQDGAAPSVALLCRVTSQNDAQDARRQAMIMAEQVQAILSSFSPAHHWRPVEDAAEFARIWRPLDWSQAHFAEIRRREELVDVHEPSSDPDACPEGNTGVYLVRPFAARDSSARPLQLMMHHRAPLMLQVSFSPTQLLDHELQHFRREIAASCWSDSLASRDEFSTGQPNDPRRFIFIYATAIQFMLLNQLLRLQAAAVLTSICVASTDPLPLMLVQAIGADLIGPPGEEVGAGNIASGRLLRGCFDLLIPENSESIAAARQNASELTFCSWGHSIAPKISRRLRYLLDPVEAASVFRFPAAADTVSCDDV